jgi:NAD(P)-dependent dehydrogenase (short-subunit alcohol dehydrogenase family)
MNVLITGASTGIGEACALRLDRNGHRVFAGVRRASDGERLRAGASPRLVAVNLDVTDAVAIERARDDVARHLGADGLHGLVNNAGIAVAGPLEHLPIDDLRRQLEINVVGQVAVTQAFLPLLRLTRGRVVFMGSIGGRMALPFLGAYSASKFALEAIADALRIELQPWGIQVALMEPGSIATPIWAKGEAAADAMQSKLPPVAIDAYGAAITAMRKAAQLTALRGVPPDVVAAAVEHALVARAPRTRYLVGRDARMRAILVQLLPDRLRDRLITSGMRLPARAAK